MNKLSKEYKFSKVSKMSKIRIFVHLLNLDQNMNFLFLSVKFRILSAKIKKIASVCRGKYMYFFQLLIRKSKLIMCGGFQFPTYTLRRECEKWTKIRREVRRQKHKKRILKRSNQFEFTEIVVNVSAKVSTLGTLLKRQLTYYI